MRRLSARIRSGSGWRIQIRSEIAAFEPLRKFSVYLLYQFIQVQVHKFQFNVSGADLRCLDKVLRQLFQAL